MAVPEGTKAVTYFLDPEMVKEIKGTAGFLDQTQSELVAEAVRKHIDSLAVSKAPESGKVRRKVAASA